MWKPTLLVCGLFWPLCTFHPHKHRSQRLKNQQSKPLHKTSQILVWNPGESRVKFTKLWIGDRFLKILSSLSWKALILTCDAFRVCFGLVVICLNDTNWNNLLAWNQAPPQNWWVSVNDQNILLTPGQLACVPLSVAWCGASCLGCTRAAQQL